MHAPFLWHASGAENTKTARASGRLFDETRFRNSVFRASSGSAAQGTVASPGPVAGSDVTIGPLLMLVHLLAVAIDRCQRYSGTVISAQVSQGFTTLVFGVERWRACREHPSGCSRQPLAPLEGIYVSDKPGRVHVFQDR